MGKSARARPPNTLATGGLWHCYNSDDIESLKAGGDVKSYVFQIELESDEDGWRAFCPPLENIGASTWGQTQEEALHNIQEVLSMIVEEFNEEGQPVPLSDEVTVSARASVTVNL